MKRKTEPPRPEMLGHLFLWFCTALVIFANPARPDTPYAPHRAPPKMATYLR